MEKKVNKWQEYIQMTANRVLQICNEATKLK